MLTCENFWVFRVLCKTCPLLAEIEAEITLAKSWWRHNYPNNYLSRFAKSRKIKQLVMYNLFLIIASLSSPLRNFTFSTLLTQILVMKWRVNIIVACTLLNIFHDTNGQFVHSRDKGKKDSWEIPETVSPVQSIFIIVWALFWGS